MTCGRGDTTTVGVVVVCERCALDDVDDLIR
jgi:hypothetical protein